MKEGWKPLSREEDAIHRPDGSLSHRDVKEVNVDRLFMEHADGATYERLDRIPLTCGGYIYIDNRYTEVTDPKLIHRPIYWLMEKLS